MPSPTVRPMQTWDRVGYYKIKTNKVNTFQVNVVCVGEVFPAPEN